MAIPKDLFQRIHQALGNTGGASDDTLPDELPEGAIATFCGTVPLSVQALYLTIAEFEAEEGEHKTYDVVRSTAYNSAYGAVQNLFVLAILHMLKQHDLPSFTVLQGWKLYELEGPPEKEPGSELPPRANGQKRPQFTLVKSE